MLDFELLSIFCPSWSHGNLFNAIMSERCMCVCVCVCVCVHKVHRNDE